MSELAEKGRDTAKPSPKLTQVDMVRMILIDGVKMSLPEIRAELHWRFGVFASEAGISARIRDLRKSKHGGYLVQCRVREKGKALREYWIDEKSWS